MKWRKSLEDLEKELIIKEINGVTSISSKFQIIATVKMNNRGRPELALYGKVEDASIKISLSENSLRLYALGILKAEECFYKLKRKMYAL